LKGWDVHHHIGGLEILDISRVWHKFVHHHIGGLEKRLVVDE
jgi:hypothetical protein